MFTQGKSIQRTLLLSLLGMLWLLAAGWLALSTHVHQRDHLDEIDHRARDTIQLLAGHNTAGAPPRPPAAPPSFLRSRRRRTS